MTIKNKIKVSIVGASGYAGGELLRLLLGHPFVEIAQVTSESNVNKFVFRVHPNLRKRTVLKFTSATKLEEADVLFLALPHGESSKRIDEFKKIGKKIIDLSGDFRLRNKDDYSAWYEWTHPRPELLPDFVYGICELHREEMKNAKYVSSAGCNATATILGLYPILKNNLAEKGRTVVEVKAGSSEGGNKSSDASHHPERSGCVRSFKPTMHRHSAEIMQELCDQVHLSVTSIEMVRGILATCHVFLNKKIDEKEIWQVYRKEYGQEPFIRIVKENDGIYRYPEPKLLSGTNYCDIGFELEKKTNRLVVISAIDNLMKGAAGQAMQAMNIMHGYDETTGLDFAGLHPI